MLSADDQERFSRHLLLDHFGGAGQERLCAGAVEIALPESFGAVARSCARALAASGVGALSLRGPWAADAAAECRRLAPAAEIVSQVHEVLAAPASDGAGSKVSIRHEGGVVRAPAAGALAQPMDLVLDGPAPASPADAAAMGAFAALEAMKLLAGAGRRGPSLHPFPAASASAT